MPCVGQFLERAASSTRRAEGGHGRANGEYVSLPSARMMIGIFGFLFYYGQSTPEQTSRLAGAFDKHPYGLGASGDAFLVVVLETETGAPGTDGPFGGETSNWGEALDFFGVRIFVPGYPGTNGNKL